MRELSKKFVSPCAKDGPAVSDYVSRLLTGGIDAELRFALVAEPTTQAHSVY